jgi:enoyl-CoA hydratase/carnithine racemase
MRRIRQLMNHVPDTHTIVHINFSAGVEEPILTQIHANGCATITLNRVKALNALNLSMIRAIYNTLVLWENDDRVSVVVLHSASPKAFCAGGDIINLARPSYPKFPSDFFREEYTLNYLIATYSKPVMSIIDGICMGGGVGLSVHGRFRIISEKALFAMPETGIGLIPDVGGSHILSKLMQPRDQTLLSDDVDNLEDSKSPVSPVGKYLALSGARLNAADLIYTGIATHFVPHSNLAKLLENLTCTHCPSSNIVDVLENILRSFARQPDETPTLQNNMSIIEDCFAADSLPQIYENLGRQTGEWALSLLKELKTKSPNSLQITMLLLRLGRTRSLRGTFISFLTTLLIRY